MGGVRNRIERFEMENVHASCFISQANNNDQYKEVPLLSVEHDTKFRGRSQQRGFTWRSEPDLIEVLVAPSRLKSSLYHDRT